MRIILFLFALLLSFSASAEETKKLRVVTSFSILEDMAKQLGGEYVEVKTLIGRGQDAHSFDPKPADAKLLKDADLVIVNGLGFDDWMAKLVEASGYKGNVAVATKTLSPLYTKEDKHNEEREHQHGSADPHAWNSPGNGHIYARNITTALAATDPAHADYYGERLSGYLLRLKEIKNWSQGKLNVIPPAARVIAVPHNTFGYLARDFGFTIQSPHGMSTMEAASAGDVALIVSAIKAKKIRAVFTENVGQGTMMQQIAADTGVKNGGVLYTDSLSDESGEAGTYLEMLQLNIERIAAALPKK